MTVDFGTESKERFKIMIIFDKKCDHNIKMQVSLFVLQQ